jgi:uncharacterized protein YbbC (DUF1343 family)
MKTGKFSKNCLSGLVIIFFISCCFSFNLALSQKIRTGAEQIEKYLPYLKNKKVALVANQTSVIGKTSLADSLLSLKVNIVRILCPEHGFRGDMGAGDTITDGVDSKTGLPLVSIYTQSKKPTPKDLSGLDLVIFDLQDVGVRYYTILPHLHYVMEACGENNVELMILDRPNPHGFYIDGTILDTAFRTFVGMHPVPIVYAMTAGEYAQMLNGEKWLKNGVQCKLNIIKCADYTHDSLYSLPVKPSPNLPNMQAVYLFPSICLFEGTHFSLGRGTDFPFQVYGHPSLKNLNFTFTPVSRKEASNPPQKNNKCYGIDLRNYDTKNIIKEKKINLEWIIDAFNRYEDKKNFFTDWINTLMGGREFREQIAKGMTENEIRKTWQPGLEKFKKIRSKYLLYEDFHN